MLKAQNIRIVTALAVIGVGVPLTVIANNRAGTAQTNLSGTAAQVGSAVGGATGSSATNSTSSGTSGSTGTTASSASASGSTTNLPADKMTVAASRTVWISPQEDATILTGVMRTSNPADLTFSVTLECSILTALSNGANDSQTAQGTVKVWVEVDGKNVGVEPAQPGQSDDGKITFCNRVYTVTTSFPNDPNAMLDQSIATEDANGFNWVAMNVGSQVHTITVHATLDASSSATKDAAQAMISSRTLVVNTTNTAQNQPQ